jgi:hypothetical protein
MTSIPIRVRHISGATKRLVIPRAEKWNCCVADFNKRLKAKKLPSEIVDPALSGKDVQLFNTQQTIRSGKFIFANISSGDENIRIQLDQISHFVRLLWMNNIDFEKDFDITLDTDSLPCLELSMSAFEDLGSKDFSLLDTPGPIYNFYDLVDDTSVGEVEEDMQDVKKPVQNGPKGFYDS